PRAATPAARPTDPARPTSRCWRPVRRRATPRSAPPAGRSALFFPSGVALLLVVCQTCRLETTPPSFSSTSGTQSHQSVTPPVLHDSAAANRNVEGCDQQHPAGRNELPRSGVRGFHRQIRLQLRPLGLHYEL